MPDPDPTAIPFVEIVPPGRVDGRIRPPGSKSLTNRALICAAFADGNSILTGALRSEDTEVMIDAVRSIGISVDVQDGGRTLSVDTSGRSRGGSPDQPTQMFIANSGTTIRFLTAALSAFGGCYRLHGVDRMHQRPIGDLVTAIDDVIDGSIAAVSAGGCPPVTISSNGWKGDRLSVAGSVSSQYLSGLMMAAPIANSHSATSGHSTAANSSPTKRIDVVGELVSRPYVDMTAKVMQSFGSDVTIIDHDSSVAVETGAAAYQGVQYAIEPDASAASYFWATAAITGGEITVDGLCANAMQGDVGFVDVLEKMGCQVRHTDDSITVIGGPLKGVDVDMNVISDTVQTLAVVALFAEGPTRVRGVAHNRFKETDRIGDLACELRKLGARVDEHEDGLTIHPPVSPTAATLETYHDHRMAMSFSLAGLKIPGVKILDPACTAKTYPEYFADLERLIGHAHRWSR
ncbi:3-phosphoshikimate 1-carboxyvinyltransferase [Rubripirellula lacrimiformis]|uniref:3-phosphoshikimate 1-carboxyvinyltransferase n=1 Tax=Rubripirellula lacrimiformis TaxID=1930273 RepID=A0A517NAM6_9BACT|nr:3-phosphoshikimate 1-carboxyvinyltransferase [Rubripirellula lacrimiformis]QDT04185.1 3-phosphoshikimate 1-carboxyvinyltransferase [Rubripirellula lacrimiformis]